MALPFYNWSRTAASNATADSTVNWAENQAPSSVNDSARAMMASTAAFRDDISGAITTGGTSTAFTVTSYQVFDTLAHLSGQMIAFTPHATNTGSSGCTLNVDSLGAKAIRSSPNVELPSGSLILGTPYVVTYNNSDSCFYLQGGLSNPYNIPLGGLMPYIGGTAPNSSFALPYGQALSRTTYSALYALQTTTFGSGDGSTTFNIPDLRGRVVAGVDNMGGSGASRLTSASGMGTGLIGQTGGAETVTLVTANLPAYTPAGTISNGAITINHNANSANNNTTTGGGGFTLPATAGATITASQATSTFAGTAQGGTSTAVNKMPPSICLNYILRII